MKNTLKILIYFIVCLVICYFIRITSDTRSLRIVLYMITLLVVIKDILYLIKQKGKKDIALFFLDTMLFEKLMRKDIDKYTNMISFFLFILSFMFVFYIYHTNSNKKQK